jgi:hypothetical protein
VQYVSLSSVRASSNLPPINPTGIKRTPGNT